MAVVDLLLAASRACRYDDVSRMVYLAELAQGAADRLEAGRHGAAAVADVRARAWAELANAYRLFDRLERAETALERAVECCEAGSGDPTLLALIADRFATLLCHRRRFPEALALLDHLAAFHLSRGEQRLAGRVLVTRGLYTANAGEPERAILHTVEALRLLAPYGRDDDALLLAALHNLLWCATELGYVKVVAECLPRVRPLYGTGRLNRLRLRWVEGLVAAGLGDAAAAEDDFQAVRAGFAAAGLAFPAAMVALDLALLWDREGRQAEILTLAEEILASFRALRVSRETVASLMLLRRACEARAECAQRADDAGVALTERILVVRQALQSLERRPR
jgi:tetratricopeptide (TPR) repeat protein